MNSTIQKLKEQIEKEEFKMRNCSHNWKESFYNPETTKEMSDYEFVGQGSDFWYKPTGWKNITKDRWTRICSKCGKEEHTYQQEAVIKEYKPKF